MGPKSSLDSRVDDCVYGLHSVSWVGNQHEYLGTILLISVDDFSPYYNISSGQYLDTLFPLSVHPWQSTTDDGSLHHLCVCERERDHLLSNLPAFHIAVNLLLHLP